ncbi:MAG: M48 family metalloprotease [Bdellovibrionota bacterium]
MENAEFHFCTKVLTTLALIFFNTTIALAAGKETSKKSASDYINSVDFGDSVTTSPTEPDAKILRRHFESDVGVQLNKPGRKWHPLIQQADSYLKEIINDLNRNNPSQDDFHWIVEIRESGEPIASAELMRLDNGLEKNERVTYKNLKLAHGITDSKPLALIHISTAMLKLVRTRSQLAFIMGHEMKHHAEGHSKSAGSLMELIHSQANEVVADKGALDFMSGKFNLDAGYSAMAELLSYQSKNAITIEEQISQIEESVTSSHHHEGLRLTLLLHSIVQRLDKNPSLRQVSDELLPGFFDEVVKTFPGKMPRSTKRDLARLLKDIKTISSEKIFQKETMDMFATFFSNNNDFWKYKDASPVFSRFLNYLSKQSDGDKSARVAFLFLVSEDGSSARHFFDKIDDQLSSQLSDVLMKLNSDGLSRNKVWTEKLGMPTLARWQSELKDIKNLTILLGQLAEKNRFWHSTVKDIQDVYAQNQKFNIYINLSTEWSVRSALASLAWLETRTEAQLRDQSVIYELPKTIVNIKSPKNNAILSAQFGHDRLEKLIMKLETSCLENYKTAKIASLSARETGDEIIIFGAAWLKFIGLGLDSIKNDQLTFLQQILRADTIRLSQIASENIDLQKTLVDLYSFASASSKFDWKTRIQIFARLAIIGESGRSFSHLFRQDQQFRQRTIEILNNDAIHYLMSIDRLQIFGNVTSAKIAILEELQFHGLLNSYLSSEKGQKSFNLFLKNAEDYVAEQTKSGYTKKSFDGYLPKDRFAKFILVWLSEILKNKPTSQKKFQDLALKAVRVLSTRYILSPEEQDLLTPFVLEKLKGLTGSEKLNMLKLLEVRRSLGRDDLVNQLADGIMGAIKEGRKMNKIWDELSETLDFKVNGQDLALSLRNVVAQKTQAQPQATNSTLSIPESTETERAQNFSGIIRLWSGFASMIQSQPFEAQVEAIEYLLGRSKNVPDFLYKINEKNRIESVNVVEESHKLRSQLADQNDYIRATFVNSLLVGPQSKIFRNEHREKLMAYLLSKVTVNNRVVARDVISALIEAEGVRAPVLLSQLLASKTLDETKMIQIALGNYLVPGMKFGQYLAFVSEFKAFESAFADFQDAAPVPGYYEIMVHIYKELNGKVDLNKIKVLGLLGAGTVNMAIEYLDLTDNQIKVINISRENIAQRTEADFARFKEFVRSLATKSSKGRDYNFVVGLTGLIERSIKLEFDRQAVFQRQKEAIQIYNDQSLGDWKLQTVSAEGLHGTTILMGKAPGITAKKLWEKDQRLYKDLLSRLYVFEHKRIFRSLQEGQMRLANPDLHDGQVLIDEKSKTITVIDFGQALPISNKQVDMSLEIVSIVSGVKSNSASLSFLNDWIKAQGSNLSLSQNELQNLLNHEDSMDRFIRLISLMNLKKAELPLESIQMVLQINRLVKLGEKTGRYPKLSIGFRLVGRELFSMLLRPRTIFAPSCEAVFRR